DWRNACRESVNIGHALMELGAWEEAIAITDEWRSHAARAQLSGVVAQATQNIGYALCRLGQTRAARDWLHRARRLETSNLRHAIGCALYLSMVARRERDWAGAEDEARLALEKSASIPSLRAQSLAALAAVLLGRGRAKEA